MAITRVQTAKNENSAGATSIACTFASPVTTGNFIVVAVTAEATAAEANFSSVTDGTNTYTRRSATWGSNDFQGGVIFDAQNVSGSVTTITANFAGSYAFRGIIATEYSGVATSNAFDQGIGNAQDAPGPGTDEITSTAVTTTQADELLFGAVFNSTDTSLWNAGTNFTEVNETTGSGVALQAEERIVSSTGSYAATWTWTSGGGSTWAMLATYKAAAGGGGGGSATKPLYPRPLF